MLSIEPIAPAIGARILNGKEELLSGEVASAIRGALADHAVLVFPQLGLSDEELIAFTKTLGTYAPDRPDGGTTAIALDDAAGANADYVRGSFFWHFDGYMNDVPILASLLTARTVSPIGGETEFCNCHAAYEALPDDRKAQIAGLSAVHALAAAQKSVEPEPDYATFQRWLEVPSKALPLVWTHRSGRMSLVIGNSAVNVVGVDPLEGMELLVWLRDWATQDRFRYRHSWRVGDVVMWDNTATLHRVLPYPADSGRLMQRTKLAGEEPIA